MAYEIEHISDHEERVWLRHVIESGTYRQPLPAEEKRLLLERMTEVDVFERYLQRAFLGQKQFSSRVSTRSSRCSTKRSSSRPRTARTGSSSAWHTAAG